MMYTHHIKSYGMSLLMILLHDITLLSLIRYYQGCSRGGGGSLGSEDPPPQDKERSTRMYEKATKMYEQVH